MFIVVAAACMFSDLKKLMRHRKRRDLAVWISVWAAGLAAVICSLRNLPVPSPLLLVIWIYQPVNTLFAAWFS